MPDSNSSVLDSKPDLSGANDLGASRFVEWQDRAELITKLAIAFLGAAYAVGLIILNLHVRKFGVNYLNFLQIEYVVVGILWFLLLGANLAAWKSIDFFWELTKPPYDFITKKWLGRVFRISSVLLIVGLTFFLFSNLISFLTNHSEGTLSVLSIGLIGNFFLTILALRWMASHARITLSAILSTDDEPVASRKKKLGQSIEIVTSGFLFLTFLTGYAYQIFPKLSSAFGGGSSQQVRFILKKDRIATIHLLGIEVNEESGVAETVDVVFEATDYFLIAPPKDVDMSIKAVRLNKELVESAQYLTR